MDGDESAWSQIVGGEWAGHGWDSLEADGDPGLVGEARSWADDPDGVLYLHSADWRAAYRVAVAVSQRARDALAARPLRPAGGPEDVRKAKRLDLPARILAAGRLDELDVPADPRPRFTEDRRRHAPLYGSMDTRQVFLYDYAAALRLAPLTLLRLPASCPPDVNRVLDLVADHRHGWRLPVIASGTVPPAQFAAVYGERIGWRLGFARPDGSPIGLAEPDAAVLNIDLPPGV